jgi:iron complex outermembrane receptor protein
MRNTIFYGLCLGMGLFGITSSYSDSGVIEEVVITSSILGETFSESNSVVELVEKDILSVSATENIGSTLESHSGISSRDFGAAVGQPVIRGMSGDRVKILSDGIVTRDVSGIGEDHVSDVDLTNIEQIEVIRGPASLLYTNGSMGGIVNVVTNTIPTKDLTDREILVAIESQSVSDGSAVKLGYEENIGGFNFTLNVSDSDHENFDVPVGAILHDEDEEHHGDEETGFLPNSDRETLSYRLGVSKVGDWGHVGLSVGKIENMYGVPFHVDAHSEDGHDDHAGEDHSDDHAGEDHSDDHDDDHAGMDHDDDHDDDHAGDDHGDEHEGERIFSTTDSEVFNLSGSFNLDAGILKKVDYFFSDSSYSHTEGHAEDDHGGEHAGEDHGDEHAGEDHGDEHAGDDHGDEDGHDAHGHGEPTTFSNDAQEYGAVFDFSGEKTTQKISIGAVTEDIAIIGSEAFMMPSTVDEFTFGYYLGREIGPFSLGLALRYDQIDKAGSVAEAHHDDDHADEEHAGEDHAEEEHTGEEHGDEHEVEITDYARDFNNSSIALSLATNLNDSIDLALNYATFERAPAEVELFMNGPHLAVGRYEEGDPSMQAEQASNIDLSLNYEKDGLFASLSFFQNDIDNYIYLEDDPLGTMEEGLLKAAYKQNDAEFDGYELEFGRGFSLTKGYLVLSFARDSVSGNFDDGSNVPRMVPERNMFKLKYTGEDFSAAFMLRDVEEQTSIAAGETATEGFQMLDINVSKTVELASGSSVQVAVFGKNLLDESARNHSSLVKNEVPLPGRNIGIKLNLTF